MERIPDAELERLATEPESDRVERKELWSKGVKGSAQEAVCAFANDLPNHRKPGVLLIGVRDDGTPAGIDVDDRLLKDLAEIRSDGRIIPPPTISVEKRSLRGHAIAVVMVAPSDSPPVRFEGRCFVRIGPRRAMATAQDERILAEKRRSLDLRWELRPHATATIEDLDLAFIRESYLPNVVSPDVLAANGRTREEQFASVNLLYARDDARPTNLGILVAGKRPSDQIPANWLTFMRFDSERFDPDALVDELSVFGRVDEIIRRTEDKFRAHNQTQIDIVSAPTEIRRYDYPPAAFEQILRNAVVHRSYEDTNAPIRIHWFRDRIEVQSTGGPFGSVTTTNFGQPGITDYRNPALAGALRNLGYVQQFGFGIAAANRALEQNGNPPVEFLADPTRIVAVIHRR
ncbi:MAG: ATP-binding protein [Fimbriimonadaceae bacterium]|nr:ATP-binding protein [Fimbriimonadaceae bacterium]